MNPSCPNCKSKKVIPIVYGYPVPELMKEAKEGKVTLGGCVVTGDDPTWFCTECDNRWRDENYTQ